MTYKLYHGDCLEVLPTLEAQSADAVIADVPYGTTACKWDSVIPFEPMWAGIKHVTKPKAAIVLFGSQPFTSALVMSNADWFKYCWVWNKVSGVGFQSVSKMPLKSHEDIAVFCSGQPTFNPQMTKGDPYTRPQSSGGAYMGRDTAQKFSGWVTVNNGLRYPKSIVKKSNADQTGRLHPTQKPVALLESVSYTHLTLPTR